MIAGRFKVGIVGLEPGRSWAARSHVPALRALSKDFELFGVANTSLASAQKAARAIGIRKAFASVDELVASPDIDIVTVAVKVPYHLEIVRAAINAGKNVYCEWPLGNGLAEAQELAELAREKGIVGVIGTQATLAPEIQYLKQLIADGYIGEVLSTSIIARGGIWGGTIPQKRNFEYLLDNANGATMLTIPFGHTLAAVRDVLGDVLELSSVLATRRTSAVVDETGETLPVNAHDQVLVAGVLADGSPISLHYRGGMPRDGGIGLFWEINGTHGDIRVKGPFGHTQMVPLSMEACRGTEKAFQSVEVPDSYRLGFPKDVEPGNVARLYDRMARDIREGSKTAPSFNQAVVIHRIIAGVERSASEGKRVHLAIL